MFALPRLALRRRILAAPLSTAAARRPPASAASVATATTAAAAPSSSSSGMPTPPSDSTTLDSSLPHDPDAAKSSREARHLLTRARPTTDRLVRTTTRAGRRAVVMKFGGSSLGSATAIRRVCDIIRHALHQTHPRGVAVVLSAMLGVTDKLIAAGEAASRKEVDKAWRLRREIFEMHEHAVRDLFEQAHPEMAHMTRELIAIELESEFDRVIEKAAYDGEMQPSDRDTLHSVGERLSSLLVCHHLLCTGTRAKIIPSSLVIATDGKYGDSQPDLKRTSILAKDRLGRLFGARTVCIVPGFYGGTPAGDIATFGRGGSDLTASIIGHAVEADEVCLWKVECERDTATGRMKRWVEGWTGIVHSVDPTHTIPMITYRDAAEMARFGRKVLHPATVGPVRDKGIRVRVANTMDPKQRGTVIVEGNERMQRKEPLSFMTVPLDKLDESVFGDTDLVKADAVVAHDTNELAGAANDLTSVIIVGVHQRDEHGKIRVDENVVKTLTQPLVDANIPFSVPKKTKAGDFSSLIIVLAKEHGTQAASILHNKFVKSIKK